MTSVPVNGAQLHVEEAGEGPAVVLVHGGLGDMRLWEPAAARLASRFRTIRYDLRFFGASTGPPEPWSHVADLVGLLDALGLERAALAGLSLGGAVALDAACAHPERVWALAHVAGSVSGNDVNPYTDEQDERFERALERGDLEAAMDVDFELWAPLGVEPLFRELWLATPEARGVTEGAMRIPPPERADLRVPALVVSARHDPPAFRALAEPLPGEHVEVDSDHYLTLREPELVASLLEEFLYPLATA